MAGLLLISACLGKSGGISSQGKLGEDSLVDFVSNTPLGGPFAMAYIPCAKVLVSLKNVKACLSGSLLRDVPFESAVPACRARPISGGIKRYAS